MKKNYSLQTYNALQEAAKETTCALLIGENPGHVTIIYKKSCDNIKVAHCFPFAKGSNGILV